jgi:multicomponent Na+:H+ antiporter subunit A
MGAPDVALVAVLIETIFALLFVGVFALLPRDVLRRESERQPPRGPRTRNAAIAARRASSRPWSSGRRSRVPSPATGWPNATSP